MAKELSDTLAEICGLFQNMPLVTLNIIEVLRKGIV